MIRMVNFKMAPAKCLMAGETMQRVIICTTFIYHTPELRGHCLACTRVFQQSMYLENVIK